MFGFVLGALCLGGLMALWMYRRPYRHHRFHGCARGSDHALLYRTFERLDTSPGQEKAITAAVAELRSRARELAPKLRASRTELASALRAETFDEPAVSRIASKHSDDLLALSAAASATLHTVHSVLDGEQRNKLARMLEWSGAGWLRGES